MPIETGQHWAELRVLRDRWAWMNTFLSRLIFESNFAVLVKGAPPLLNTRWCPRVNLSELNLKWCSIKVGFLKSFYLPWNCFKIPLPGEGNGNPLQYYCLENPMDRGAWQATVHGVAKSRTRLSDFTFLSLTSLKYVVPLYSSFSYWLSSLY